MAVADAGSSNPQPPPPANDVRSRALADIHFNSVLSADNGTSSEDEVPDAPVIPEEDVEAVLGVAISQQQTRLTSPKTPAVEKAAAIEEAGGFFGAFDAGHEALSEEPEDEEDGQRIEPSQHAIENRRADAQTAPERSNPRSPVRLPSPWRAEPRIFVKSNKSRSKLTMRDGMMLGRRRASSGPPESTFDSWHKSFMANLPSMPKYLSSTVPPSQIGGSDDNARSAAAARRKRSSVTWTMGNVDGTSSRRTSPRRISDGNNDNLAEASVRTPSETEFAPISGLPSKPITRSAGVPQLRRSASDHSLVVQRTLSTASSLGDDTRFEHISEQVNSRFKAIKDSLQDSNIKIPSLPSISSITSYRPDFFRERSGSINGVKPRIDPAYGESMSGQTEKPVDPMTRQPYQTAKEAVSDTTRGKQSQHPQLNRALEQLEGDVIVLGGYRGSILRTAEAPHRQVWVPIKVGLNLRKVDLEVGLNEDDDERASERIVPGGMLSHVGPVDISRRLLKRLRSCENARQGRLRVHDYGYDWRLHPAYLSAQLIKFIEGLPCNKPGIAKEKRGVTVLAHSLGGLITRHAVNQRPELFRGVVYAGVPNTCVNILGPMRNGDEVLLSSRVLTAQVNFTIRTSFALLPLDGRCFFDINTKEEYHVDFFDPKTWIDYCLSPCVARPLPPLVPQPKPSGIASYMSSMANALPSLPIPGRKGSLTNSTQSKAITASGIAEPSDPSAGDAVAQGNVDIPDMSRRPDADMSSSPRTAVTLPRDELIAYLTRTLATVKKFKQELVHNPKHTAANAYPPVSVIYGKTTPTVYGARVNGREGIKHADAYDALAFASGDGVVLAKAAMVPEGYTTARGGIVSSDRGHVTLLGDLEAVGRCLNAVIAARRRGVGDGAA